MKNYYDILEISPDASDEVIRGLYKTLAKNHPDVYKGDPQLAERRMQEINEAYEVLSDADKRKAYNAELSRLSAHAADKTHAAVNTANETATAKQTAQSSPYRSDIPRGKRAGIFAIFFGIAALLVMTLFPVITIKGTPYPFTELWGVCANDEDVRIGCMILLLAYGVCIFYTVKSLFSVLGDLLLTGSVSKDIFGYVVAFCICVGGFAWLAGESYSCHPIVYALLVGSCAGVSI